MIIIIYTICTIRLTLLVLYRWIHVDGFILIEILLFLYNFLGAYAWDDHQELMLGIASTSLYMKIYSIINWGMILISLNPIRKRLRNLKFWKEKWIVRYMNLILNKEFHLLVCHDTSLSTKQIFDFMFIWLFELFWMFDMRFHALYFHSNFFYYIFKLYYYIDINVWRFVLDYKAHSPFLFFFSELEYLYLTNVGIVIWNDWLGRRPSIPVGWLNFINYVRFNIYLNTIFVVN